MADHDEFREEILLDEGHPHAYDRTEPKGNLIFVFGLLTVVFVILSAVAIQYYYDRTFEEQVYQEVLAPESDTLQNLRSKEDQELHSFGYVDRNAGKVRLTIDRAMELTALEAKEGRSKYPTAPYKVKTAADLAADAATPPVSAPGAAAANASQQQGVGSTSNAQPPAPKH